MSDGAWVDRELQFSIGAVRFHHRIISPESGGWARVFIVHGYGEHGGRYLHFMRWMAGHGVRCEVIDQRGHGRSGGRRGYVRQWGEFLDDLQSFFSLSGRASDAESRLPIFVLGHSHGGLVTAAAEERGILHRAGIAGCILSSPYLATLMHFPLSKRILATVANRLVPWLRVRSGLRREWLSRDAEMVAEDQADKLLNQSATPRWFLTMRREQAAVIGSASAFTLPLLCLAGTADVVADPAVTVAFYSGAGSADKSIYCYPEHLHELLREKGREKVFADILGWIQARVVARPDGNVANSRS